jgi:outer membrane protein assembly factor BamB
MQSSAARARLFVCALTLAAAGPALADNWPQWRGPTNDGVSRETGLPTRWSESENVAWKLPLPGMGGSTPAVWGDRLFLTSEDKDDLVLLCVSTAGKELWKRPLGNGKLRYRIDEGNGASASPCTDGKHVWAFTGTGDLACFDLDGTEVWRLNAQDRYGKFRIMHGMHTSPLLDGDRLYLQLLHSGGSWVVALDKNTGKELWKVRRESDGKGECLESYASPVIWRHGDDAVLVTHGNDYAIGHRLDTGAEVWRVGGLNPRDHYNASLRLVATPVAVGDLLVVPSAKDGPVVAIGPGATGLVEAGSRFELWRRKTNTPDVPSPLVHDGLLYLCRENGMLICMDARTGKEHYSHRLHPARYRASPVFASGHVYLTARDGAVTVVKAGPAFEQVAVNKFPDEVSASPAVADGRLYFRGFNTLYAVGAPAK